MHQCRLPIDLLHIGGVLDGGRGLGSMAQDLRCLAAGLGVPIAYGRWKFLRKVHKVVVVSFEGVCTDEHVSLVLWTPAISDGDHGYGQPEWMVQTTRQTTPEVADQLKP